MDYTKDLESVLTKMQIERQSVRNELRSSAQGCLMISKNAAGTCYYRVTTENGKRVLSGIGRKMQLVYKLARQAYLEECAKRLDINIAAIKKASDKLRPLDSDSIFAAMPKNFNILDRRLILGHVLSEFNKPFSAINKPIMNPVRDSSAIPVQLQIMIDNLDPHEWGAMEYCENTSFLERKNNLTNHGIYARSKSEVAILDLYYEKQIPIHYDELALAGNEYISPDFIGLRKDGSVVIHEHVGLLSDSKYAERHYNKLETYRNLGFEQGRNLLVTFDDGNGHINLPLISMQIDDIYSI